MRFDRKARPADAELAAGVLASLAQTAPSVKEATRKETSRGKKRTRKRNQLRPYIDGKLLRAGGKMFPIDHVENLPEGHAVLALVDESSVSVQLLGKDEMAAVKAQLQSGTSGLSSTEEEGLNAGGVGPADLKMGRALWALARQKSADKYAALVSDSLTVEQAAARLKVGPSRVRQLLGTFRLYGVKVAGSDWRIPSFQFLKRGGLIPGFDKITMRVIPKRVPLLPFYNWLTTPNPDLRTRDEEEEAVSPLDWLRMGEAPEEAAALTDAL